MPLERKPLKPQQAQLTTLPKLSAELPFFNLTYRRKDIPKIIEFSGRDAQGRPLRWEVHQDATKKIGPPGVEAHQVWIMLVRPAVDKCRDENGRLPDVVPLGGVRECLRKIGWTVGGRQAQELLKALTQIAFAGCIADLWLPTGKCNASGKETYLQIKGRFSKLSVYAIGEHHLTESDLAAKEFEFELEDTIYIKLDPLEIKLQEAQERRIYDNEYMFSVSPIGRRWYELMAAKFFGVLKNEAAYCEIRYSWYVNHHHTLKKCDERRRVIEQMNRVAKDHLASGYIDKIEYRAVKKAGEETDYIIRYYPGVAAIASTKRIHDHLNPGAKQIMSGDGDNAPESASDTKENKAGEEERRDHQADPENNFEFLFNQLILREIEAPRARKLLTEELAPDQPIMAQLEYLDEKVARGGKSFRNPSGYYITQLCENVAVPADFETSYERRAREAVEQQEKTVQENKELQDQLLALAYAEYTEQTGRAFIMEALSETERLELFETAQAELVEAYPDSAKWLKKMSPERRAEEIENGSIFKHALEIIKPRLTLQTFAEFADNFDSAQAMINLASRFADK